MLIQHPERRIDVKDILLDSDVRRKLENPPHSKESLHSIQGISSIDMNGEQEPQLGARTRGLCGVSATRATIGSFSPISVYTVTGEPTILRPRRTRTLKICAIVYSADVNVHEPASQGWVMVRHSYISLCVVSKCYAS